MLTPEELDYIRTAAIGDMLGDSTELDKLGPAATIFRLCRELELSRKHAVTMSEVAAAAWEGEIPSPLPGHTHMTEEEFTERYNCPWCGGSGHIDDCDEADKQVKAQLERLDWEADWLEQSNLWIAAVAFNGTASDYGSLYGLVEAAHDAVRGRQMNEHALNGLDAGLEQRQWEIGAIVEHLREMKERCGQERYQCLLDSAVNELLYVDDSLLTIRKILEESCPKN